MNAYTIPDYGSKEAVLDPRTGKPMSVEDAEAQIGKLLDAPISPAAIEHAFDHVNMTLLADECAKKLWRFDTIAERFGVTLEQLLMISQKPAFKKMVAIQRALWEGADNAKTRAQTYYQTGVALGAASIVSMIQDPSKTDTVRLEANKQSAMIAGMIGGGRGDGTGGGAASFAVNIHLGGRTETMTISQPTIDATVANQDDSQ